MRRVEETWIHKAELRARITILRVAAHYGTSMRRRALSTFLREAGKASGSRTRPRRGPRSHHQPGLAQAASTPGPVALGSKSRRPLSCVRARPGSGPALIKTSPLTRPGGAAHCSKLPRPPDLQILTGLPVPVCPVADRRSRLGGS